MNDLTPPQPTAPRFSIARSSCPNGSLVALVACAASLCNPGHLPTAHAESFEGITPISDVNANTAQGLSPLEFMQVTIEGIVQLGIGVVDPFDQASPSTWLYVSDGTGGVAIVHSGQVNAPVVAGGRVRVTSVVATQGISPISGTRTLDLLFGGTIEVIGSGSVDAPVKITASELLTAGATFEGTRIRIADLILLDPGEWPTAGGSGFVRVTDGSVEVMVYVDDDTDLAGSSPPAGPAIFDGFVAQNDTFPFLDDHYIYLLAVDGPVSVEDSSWGLVKSIYR